MFLHQKFDYKSRVIQNDDLTLPAIVKGEFESDSPDYLAFDTETTGLNILTDKPFLLSFGWKANGGRSKKVFVFEPHKNKAMLSVFEYMMQCVGYAFAHNVQYDYHMLTNICADLKHIRFADGMAVARLTQYADTIARLSLETLGIKYVDPDAKFGGKVIRDKIIELRKVEKDRVRELYAEKFDLKTFNVAFKRMEDSVKCVTSDDDEVAFIRENYTEPNYESVYKTNPGLMLNYAMDDVVILLEFLDKALPTLRETDPGFKTFRRECDLVPYVCAMEREGLKVNVDYLVESRARVVDYQRYLYDNLLDLTEKTFTVGQHDVIKQLLYSKYRIELDNADEASLSKAVRETKNDEAKEVIKTILELRTLDKWLSTYIDGKLNSMIDGRIHTSINSQGTVSGRVSSNMQQQPKASLDTRTEIELFHPRRMFVPDPGEALVFFDFSQMEMRLQAYYTLLISGGDLNLCRAYIPFECISEVTGEKYDYKNPDHMARWDSGEWVYPENNVQWEPIDVHCVTTHIAYPNEPYVSLSNNELNSKAFKKLRRNGKMCNFLKNYQGGVQAIKEQMDVDDETAEILDKAYYQAFPKVKDYQRWVSREMALYGYVENLYGRRYYMEDSAWFYKAGNYLIQGGCADLVKQKELEVCKMLKSHNFKTRFVLPVHDELIFRVPLHELNEVIPKIKAIMEDNAKEIPWIPMITEVEYTTTNWAEKRHWEGA